MDTIRRERNVLDYVYLYPVSFSGIDRMAGYVGGAVRCGDEAEAEGKGEQG